MTRITRCLGVRRGGICDSKSLWYGMEEDDDEEDDDGVVMVVVCSGSKSNVDSWRLLELPDMSLLSSMSSLFLLNCQNVLVIKIVWISCVGRRS